MRFFIDEKPEFMYISIMRIITLLSSILLIMIFSCVSDQKPAEEPAEEPGTPVSVAQPQEPAPVQPPEQPVTPPKPAIQEPPPAVISVAEPAPAPIEKVFDPGSITEEKYESTKTDVKAYIAELNRIIRAKNFNSWKTFLSDSFYEEISSPAFLEERTEDLFKRDQIVASNMGRDPRRVTKKILRNAKDYFDNVVVPSRQNDRVDDIEFKTEEQVIAYTIDSRGNRLILYHLELINNTWKIIN